MQYDNTETRELVQKLASIKEQAPQQPGAFQEAVIALLSSIDERLKKLEEKWNKPLIH